MSSFQYQEDSDTRKEVEMDCEHYYFAEDLGTKMLCILTAGHLGLHLDATGVEWP
jgi:hypothetical protein